MLRRGRRASLENKEELFVGGHIWSISGYITDGRFHVIDGHGDDSGDDVHDTDDQDENAHKYADTMKSLMGLVEEIKDEYKSYENSVTQGFLAKATIEFENLPWWLSGEAKVDRGAFTTFIWQAATSLEAILRAINQHEFTPENVNLIAPFFRALQALADHLPRTGKDWNADYKREYHVMLDRVAEAFEQAKLKLNAFSTTKQFNPYIVQPLMSMRSLCPE